MKLRDLIAKLNGTYDYSSTQFNLPSQIANKIINWGKENIPDENLYHDEDGGKGREDEIHCTLLYGIHAEESPEILELVKEPIKVELGKIEKFDQDDYDVIKVTVLDKSGKLEELWNGIKNAEKYTSDYDKKFEPHVTIAYVKKGSCDDIIDSDPFAGDIVVLDNFKFSSTDKSKTKFKKLSGKGKLQPVEVRQYLYHCSHPDNRDSILQHGLEPRVGDNSYGYYEGQPAIFATNSNNVSELFDSTWDDDIWQIDARSGNTWYVDPYFAKFVVKEPHVITFEHISPEYLKLVYEGSGEDKLYSEESKEELYGGGTVDNNRLKNLKLASNDLKFSFREHVSESKDIFYFFNIVKGSEEVCSLTCTNAPSDDKSIFVIRSVRTDGRFKRQGLATKLYNYAVEEMGNKGYKLVHDDEFSDEGEAWKDSLGIKLADKQLYTLQIGNATDMMRAIQALDELQNVRLNYTVSGDALLFGKQEDLNDAKTLLQKNGILALEKRSISKDHITEDLGRFDIIKEDAQNIEENVDELKKDDNKLIKQMSIKKYNFFTGEDEPVEVESEIVAVVDGMGEGVGEEATEECCDGKINPDQSKEAIKNQLLEEFISQYPKAQTYENLFSCATDCGLVEAMDRYDIVNILNGVAMECGLQRKDFAEFFPADEITESADIQGISGSPEFNEGDMEEALNEFKESFENSAESLYEIDRILEERYRMLFDGEKLVDESKEIVRKSLHKIKKEAIVKKYFMSDMKIKELDRSGRCIQGKLIYKVQMVQAGKINRTIVVELPIKANQVQAPREFSYNNDTYPLETYFLNDIFDR